MTFDDALAHVLRHEGGYSDHPKDPGGATMRGVTQRTYDGWRTRAGLATQPVRGISDDEIGAIYRVQYWDRVRGDDLPDGVDLAVFDYAVNSGPARAARDLQRIVGETIDGVIGENTLGAVRSMDPAQVVNALCDARLDFMRGLKTWQTFGKGWSRRVEAVREAGLRGSSLAPNVAPMPAARAVEVPEAPTVAIAKTWGERAVYGGGGAAIGVWPSLTETERLLVLGVAGALVIGAAFVAVRVALRRRWI